MTTMNSEVYKALVEAGASELSAEGAAESIADSEIRFSKIEASMMLLKWMVGFNLALTIAMFSLVVKIVVM